MGAALSLLTFATTLCADGIPEPSLILYGVVTDSSGSGSRVSFGTLTWVFQPAAGGAAITVTGTLTNINDQFSYVLRLPCETEIPGVPISPGALKLAATGTLYDRSQVTIAGVPATFSQPAQTNLILAPTDRGRIERVDLAVSLNLGNLLPDAWQLQYFGHTGVDPNDDPDHDGMSNYAEYRAGTNPTDPQSRFEIMRVTPDPAGGIAIVWSSVQGKSYTLQRSGDLLTAFGDLQTNVPGVGPTNFFRDASAVGHGPYFYRVRVE